MIYWPASCRLLNVGHIKCLEKLTQKDFVIVGLLTKKAMKGYKDELVSFKDRKYILDSLNIDGYIVVPQNSLDPTQNLIKYQCTHMASGDGWEQVELDAMKKLGVKPINVKSGYRQHTSGIISK